MNQDEYLMACVFYIYDQCSIQFNNDNNRKNNTNVLNVGSSRWERALNT